MAMSKSHGKKAPSQNPVGFYKMQPSKGKAGSCPDQLSGGPMREKIMGAKSGRK